MGDDHFLNLQPGTVVNGRYEVVKCLGAGSMGMVYACRHRELAGHLVAMKVLFTEVARDEVAAARFRNEIVASYGVSHPNVVRAYEYFKDGDLVAFTMEYIDGGDLADRITSQSRLEIDEIIRMLGQMCSGVHAIHQAGIIHRDLKPENILITNQGDIKITDFGIARRGTGPKLTEHGGVVGTLDYVSPEYLESGQVDERSDIYALGVLAYEMITGEPPFKGQSVIETMTMRLRTDAPSASRVRPECPPGLSNAIMKAMARDPKKRYQTAAEMLKDLSALGAPSLPSYYSFRSRGGSKGDSGANGGLATESNATPGTPGGGPMAGIEFKSPESPSQTAGVGLRGRDSALAGTVLLDAEMLERVEAEMADEEEMWVQPMESVLSNRNNQQEDNEIETTEEVVVPTVSISQSRLSQERVKELFSNVYPEESTSPLKGFFLIVLWIAVVLLALGLAFLVVEHYRPGFAEQIREVIIRLKERT